MSFLKTFFKYGLYSFQATTRTSKIWLAITSDSNLFFKMGKTRRQKDGCSFYRVKFIRAWITLHPRSDVRLSASFLVKEEKSSLHLKYFSFNDSSGKYLLLTWCTMIFEIQSNLQFCIKLATQSMPND